MHQGAGTAASRALARLEDLFDQCRVLCFDLAARLEAVVVPFARHSPVKYSDRSVRRRPLLFEHTLLELADVIVNR